MKIEEIARIAHDANSTFVNIACRDIRIYQEWQRFTWDNLSDVQREISVQSAEYIKTHSPDFDTNGSYTGSAWRGNKFSPAYYSTFVPIFGEIVRSLLPRLKA